MNKQIKLPYGNGHITIPVPEEKLLGVFEPRSLPPVPDPEAELRRALAEPVGAPPLRKKAQGAASVAIVVEDVSRPVPSALLLDARLSPRTSRGSR